ncbi:MAG: short-chain dehydrogenase/reductase [Gammaproteobacteria bacterium]|nr:short-chain dehydrogenase/reductase [Gammaproteobacteria bacterium]
METPTSIAQKIPHEAEIETKQPGRQYKMKPKPKMDKKEYQGCNKLKNKVAIITGGDSGIGGAVALLYAKEGADVTIAYLNEHEDAKLIKRQVEEIGRRCLLIAGDVGKEIFCKKVVESTLKHFDKIDILINNAAVQYPQDSIVDISAEQLLETFRTNIFSYFFMIKAALPYLKKGASIINTTSVTAYKGSKELIDYSATKGAIVALTRSLSESIIDKGIRVNAVAPGPIWTPLIPASFSKKHIKEFGKNVPMKRPGQPDEVAPCYVFLASEDSSYMSGQVLHPNGGKIING